MSDWVWLNEIEQQVNIALSTIQPEPIWRDIKHLIDTVKVMRDSLKWIMPKVHQGNHDGEFDLCKKATCVEYRKALNKAGRME